MRQLISMLKKRDYTIYFLSTNPFPYTPIPSQEPNIFINQEKTISGLMDTVATTYTTGQSSHAILIGPYGSGKSHALKYIERLIKEISTEDDEKKAIACYISSLGTSFLHIYREFMEKVGLEVIRETINAPLTFDLSYNISRIFDVLNDTELYLYAWRWLLGERLESRDRSRLGVSRNMDDILALSTFQRVIDQLRINGYGLICLLIDELETINELYPYQRQAMFNNLRRMIDDNPKGLCSIYACTPAGWDEILERSLAFSRRLSRNLLYLSRLNEEETVQVIKEYLQSYRNLQHKSGKMFSDLHPFTHEAALELHGLSRGNIGELVKYCNLAIDRGLDEGLTKIDSEDITKLLTDFRG